MFWTPPSIPWLTLCLIHLVKHRQLKFLGHIFRMSKEEPAQRYALCIPTIGKRRPGRPHTSYLPYVQRLLGDNEGAMQEQQIATLADDHRARRNLVVACSAADGWWWWWMMMMNPMEPFISGVSRYCQESICDYTEGYI